MVATEGLSSVYVAATVGAPSGAAAGPGGAAAAASAGIAVMRLPLPAATLPQRPETFRGELPPAAAASCGAPGAPGAWRLAVLADVASGEEAALLLAPGGALLEWALGEERPQLLSDDADNLAIAAASADGHWLLLSATFGELRFVPETGGAGGGMEAAGPSAAARAAAAAAAAAAPRGPLTPEQEGRVHQLLDAAVAQLEAAGGRAPAAAAGGGGHGGGGLAARLRSMGVLGAGADASAVARYASSLLDCVPKGWSGGEPGAGGGRAGATTTVREQLEAKARRHDLLLASLHAGGALGALPPATVAALWAGACQLAAVSAALAVQAALQTDAGDAQRERADGRRARVRGHPE